MRCIIGLSLLGLLSLTASAVAQFPPNYGGNQYGGFGGGWGGGFGSNFNPYGGINVGAAGAFRGPNAPLSPYLNLLNPNPAVNYFNFVRPNTFSPFRGAGLSPFPAGGRQSFFPTLSDIDEEDFPRSSEYKVKLPNGEEETRVKMGPTGHPAAYGNTMGYFGPLTTSQGGIGSAGNRGMKPTGSTSGRK
jgi:hypothetical protein